MRRTPARDREALGLAACAQSRAVRLRPSLADYVVAVARWTLAVAGFAVAVWAGGVLLATPASAAVVVPMAATQGMTKGGKDNSGGSKGGKSASGGEKKHSDGGAKKHSDAGKKDAGAAKKTEKQHENQSKKQSEKRSKTTSDAKLKKKSDAKPEKKQAGAPKPGTHEKAPQAEKDRRAGTKPAGHEKRGAVEKDGADRAKHAGEQKADRRRGTAAKKTSGARPGEQAGESAGKKPESSATRSVGEPRKAAGDSGSTKARSASPVVDARTKARTGAGGIGERPADKHAAEKSAAEKGTVARSTVAKRPVAKSVKSAAEKRAAERSAAERSAAEKSAVAKSMVEKRPAEKRPAEKSAAEKGPAEKHATDGKRPAATKARSAKSAGSNVDGGTMRPGDTARTGGAARPDANEAGRSIDAARIAALRDQFAVDPAGVRRELAGVGPSRQGQQVGSRIRETAQILETAQIREALSARTVGGAKTASADRRELNQFAERIRRSVESARFAAEAHGGVDTRSARRDLAAAVQHFLRDEAAPPAVRAAVARALAHGTGVEHAIVDTARRNPSCSGGAATCRQAVPTRSGDGRSASVRGPPRVAPSDGKARTGAPANGYGAWPTVEGNIDQSAATEALLKRQIAAENGSWDLARQRQKVAAGKETRAAYAKAVAAQRGRAVALAAARRVVTRENARLVDEVIDGQRALAAAHQKLAAQERAAQKPAARQPVGQKSTAQKPAAQKSTAHRRATPNPSAARITAARRAYTALRERVYARTDALRDVIGRDEPDTVSGDDAAGGAAAGCGSSGVFVECRAAVDGARQRDDRCVAIAGVGTCSVSATAGRASARAGCVLAGKGAGCSSSAVRAGTSAQARCSLGAGDCSESAVATLDGAQAGCETNAGACDASGSATRRPVRAAPHGQLSAWHQHATRHQHATTASGTGRCTAASVGCDVTVSVTLHGADGPVADAVTHCVQRAARCTGTATTRTGVATRTTGATVVPARPRAAAAKTRTATLRTAAAQPITRLVAAQSLRSATAVATCTISGGDCRTHTDAAPGDARDVANARAAAECGGSPACAGHAGTTTSGRVTAPGRTANARQAVRTTVARSSCATQGGGCGSAATSTAGTAAAAVVSANLVPSARQISADSTATAHADCATASCTGSGMASTNGAAAADVKGVRDSTARAVCSAHGTGGSCTGSATNVVAPTGRGPVSASQATSTVSCAGSSTGCGGSATTTVSARDTAVTKKARGVTTSATCTAAGGGCTGEATAAAYSAPDHLVLDPRTGRPLPGQSRTGPSATGTSSARLDCPAGTRCTGTVATAARGTDGTLVRPSQANATCRTGTGGCRLAAVSSASPGPGATLALAGSTTRPNLKRLAKGPSAAATAGAVLLCQDTPRCSGTVGSAAAGTDPVVSPHPRGSRSTGSCTAVTGGVCQAVTNSGGATGPDANAITPLMRAASTANAKVVTKNTGDQPHPTDKKQPEPAVPAPTAPGSSANSGGPTVPGASSWTMAGATLDCAGSATGCAGSAGTSAVGSGGPRQRHGADSARGPPSGRSATSGTCVTSDRGCQVETNSTAASGQVVADIVAQRQHAEAARLATAAQQAQQRARTARQAATTVGATARQREVAKRATAAATRARQTARQVARLAAKPVTDAPAAYSESDAVGRCSGARCATGTVGATSGAPGSTHTEATCTAAAHGCATSSAVTASLTADAPHTTATSAGTCPEAHCVAVLRGDARGATAHVRSSARGDTRCTGRTACTARIETGTTRTFAAGRPVGAGTFVSARCADGSARGCATHTRSVTQAPHASAVAACRAGTCRSQTGGIAAPGFTQVQATCGGTRCTTVTRGHARSAGNTASARSACTAARDGRCAGSSQVGVTRNAAQSGASCTATKGSACRYSYRAASHAAARGAHAAAVGHGRGHTGGGQAATSAAASSGPGFAQAMASCTGTKGTSCRHSYSATAAASATSAGSSASAYAHGSGGGRKGGGGVAVAARASAAPGQASASASCSGAAHCTHSYSATASVAAASAGSSASAYAHGSGGGGRGSGGVGVSAQASAAPGQASASASCSGAANCVHSYSATAAASAASAGSSASAYAHGSGGGGRGGGGVGVSAQASASPGEASASASCAGAANCTYSYSAHAAAHAAYADAGHHSSASAHASGSGGGSGPGGGGVGVWAQAAAGKGYANATAGCVGAANCTAGYRSHADAAQNHGGHTGSAVSDCSGSGSGSCATAATVAVVGAGVAAQSACSGSGRCSQHARVNGVRQTPDGLRMTAGVPCWGASGSCTVAESTAVDATTGRFLGAAECRSTGASHCGTREVHVRASGSAPATDGFGAVHGALRGDCVRSAADCALTGLWHYTASTLPYGPYSDPTAEHTTPATLTAQIACAPAGPGCTTSAKAWASGSKQVTAADHTGTYRGRSVAACSGSGACGVAASLGFDPTTGWVEAGAGCTATGSSRCTQLQAHTSASVRSTDGVLVSHPVLADCAAGSGVCDVVSQARYVPKSAADPSAGLLLGVNCSGPAAACHTRFDAAGKAVADASGLHGEFTSRCTFAGGGGAHSCGLAATASVDADKHLATAIGACTASAGVSCSYGGKATANATTDVDRRATAEKSCGKAASGSCGLAAAAQAGGDDGHRAAFVSGQCTDTNHTCRGVLSAHVDSGWDTWGTCSTGGNGYCGVDATKEQAQTWGTSDAPLDLHTKAPDREAHRTCGKPGDCPTATHDGTRGAVPTLTSETQKSWGEFGKNLVRDGAGLFKGMVSGPCGPATIACALAKEAWYWSNGAMLWDAAHGRRPHGFDSWQDYVDTHPITGGIMDGVKDTALRLGPTVVVGDVLLMPGLNAVAGGVLTASPGARHWVTDWVGDSWQRTGHDYYFAPVSSAVDDIGTIAIAADGIGLAVKGVSAGLKVASVAGETTAALDVVAETSLRIGSITGKVGFAQVTIPLAAMRLATRLSAGLLARGVFRPLAGVASRRAAVLTARADGAVQRSLPVASYRARATRAAAAASTLNRAAELGTIVGRGGWLVSRETPTGTMPSLAATLRASRTLGLPIGGDLTRGRVLAAYTAALDRGVDAARLDRSRDVLLRNDALNGRPGALRQWWDRQLTAWRTTRATADAGKAGAPAVTTGNSAALVHRATDRLRRATLGTARFMGWQTDPRGPPSRAKRAARLGVIAAGDAGLIAAVWEAGRLTGWNLPHAWAIPVAVGLFQAGFKAAQAARVTYVKVRGNRARGLEQDPSAMASKTAFRQARIAALVAAVADLDLPPTVKVATLGALTALSTGVQLKALGKARLLGAVQSGVWGATGALATLKGVPPAVAEAAPLLAAGLGSAITDKLTQVYGRYKLGHATGQRANARLRGTPDAPGSRGLWTRPEAERQYRYLGQLDWRNTLLKIDTLTGFVIAQTLLSHDVTSVAGLVGRSAAAVGAGVGVHGLREWLAHRWRLGDFNSTRAMASPLSRPRGRLGGALVDVERALAGRDLTDPATRSATAQRLADALWPTEPTGDLVGWAAEPTTRGVHAARGRARAAAAAHDRAVRAAHTAAVTELARDLAAREPSGTTGAVAALLAEVRAVGERRAPAPGTFLDALRTVRRTQAAARAADRELALALQRHYRPGSAGREAVENYLRWWEAINDIAKELPTDLDPVAGASRWLRDNAAGVHDPAAGDLRGSGALPSERMLDRELVAKAGVLAREQALTAAARAIDRAATDRRLDAVLAGPRELDPTSPLGTITTLAGARHPVTAADLARHLGRPGERAQLQGTLARLRSAGLLSGTAARGYRARPELIDAWREAPPRVRAALQRDLQALPGAEAVVGLQDLHAGRAALTTAHDHLVDLTRRLSKPYLPATSGLRYELRTLGNALTDRLHGIRPDPAPHSGLGADLRSARTGITDRIGGIMRRDRAARADTTLSKLDELNAVTAQLRALDREIAAGPTVTAAQVARAERLLARHTRAQHAAGAVRSWQSWFGKLAHDDAYDAAQHLRDRLRDPHPDHPSGPPVAPGAPDAPSRGGAAPATDDGAPTQPDPVAGTGNNGPPADAHPAASETTTPGRRTLGTWLRALRNGGATPALLLVAGTAPLILHGPGHGVLAAGVGPLFVLRGLRPDETIRTSIPDSTGTWHEVRIGRPGRNQLSITVNPGAAAEPAETVELTRQRGGAWRAVTDSGLDLTDGWESPDPRIRLLADLADEVRDQLGAAGLGPRTTAQLAELLAENIRKGRAAEQSLGIEATGKTRIAVRTVVGGKVVVNYAYPDRLTFTPAGTGQLGVLEEVKNSATLSGRELEQLARFRTYALENQLKLVYHVSTRMQLPPEVAKLAGDGHGGTIEFIRHTGPPWE